MDTRKQDRDILLVKKVRSGSEEGWTELYGRFHVLVREVVRRQAWNPSKHDVEDVSQNVFLELLATAPHWTTMTERTTCRSSSAPLPGGWPSEKSADGRPIKRSGPGNPVAHHDGSDEAASVLVSEDLSQEKQLELAELKEMLKEALWRLSSKCREIIRLRDYELLSFKEMEQETGTKENTLTVQRKRCLDELRAVYYEILRKGCDR